MFRFYVLLVLIIKDVINYKIILSIKTLLWTNSLFMVKNEFPDQVQSIMECQGEE